MKILKISLTLLSLITIHQSNLIACSSEIEPAQNMEKIYKILTPTEWQLFQKDKTFAGSKIDLDSGFIQAAFAEQKDNVLGKFFKGISQVVVLELDSKKLPQGALKLEVNKSDGDKYPQIYGVIPIEAVKANKVVLQ